MEKSQNTLDHSIERYPDEYDDSISQKEGKEVQDKEEKDRFGKKTKENKNYVMSNKRSVIQLALLIFYYFLVYFFSAITEVVNVVFRHQNRMIFQVKMILILLLTIFGIISFYLILRKKVQNQNKIDLLISLLLTFLQLFIVITGKNFLEQISNEEVKGGLDKSLVLICTICVLYTVQFQNFIGLASVYTFTCLIYLMQILVVRENILNEVLSLIILILVSYILSQKVISNLKKRNIVSVQESEENQPEKLRKQNSQLIKSNTISLWVQDTQNKTQQNEMDKIILKLRDVMQLLKNTSLKLPKSKEELMQAQRDLEYILRKILSEEDLFKFDINEKLEKDQEISEQYKIHIKEQYQPVTFLQANNTLAQKSKLMESEIISIQQIEASLAFKNDQIIPELKNILKYAGRNWNFDIFFLSNLTQNKPLSSIASFVLKHIIKVKEIFQIEEEIFDKYFTTIESKYLDNPYHNCNHGADVCNSILCFMFNSFLKEEVSNMDVLACVVASCGHDVGHPALNNRFLINSKDQLALTYNDISVLENMHSSITFKEMKKQEANILKNFVQKDFDYIRKLIIEMILSTDMATHFDNLGKFKTKSENGEGLSLEKIEDKILILKIAMKCSDIGHSCKE